MTTGTASISFLGGSANPDLTASVAQELNLEPCAVALDRFPDGEVSVRLRETVRRKHVFLLQSTSPPVDNHLIELLALADACRRDSAAKITAIIPYFGYARSDTRHGNRESISAGMVANLLQAVGIQHIITLDLHTPQIEGFFHIPMDTLSAVPLLADAIRPRIPSGTVVISPDAGRVSMAGRYAEHMHAPMAVLYKQRLSDSETRVLQLIGDVRNRPCLIIDDMITTGGTVASSIEALLQAGAKEEFYLATTHGLFVGDARRRISHHGVRQIFTTDTVAAHAQTWTIVEVISAAALISDAIRRNFSGQGA